MQWAAVFVWMVVIFIFSTDSFSAARTTAPLLTPTISFVIRKLAHWSEYFILAVLLMRALNARSDGFIAKRHMLCSVVWAVIYAGIDEWHQIICAEPPSQSRRCDNRRRRRCLWHFGMVLAKIC
jgi:VanZ family protein